jgi:hypothetical protein
MAAAPLGPWTRANDEAGRLQTLLQLGDRALLREIQSEVDALIERIKTLPESPGDDDQLVIPWSVREAVLDTGLEAAMQQRQWDRALYFSNLLVDSRCRRGATTYEIARVKISSYGALVELGRFADAESMLDQCQHDAEATNDITLLGIVFSSRADWYAKKGYPSDAVAFEKIGLRFAYLQEDSIGLRFGHTKLAEYMSAAGDHRGAARHDLAASMLAFLTGERFTDVLRAAALRFGALKSARFSIVPDSYEDVRDCVESVDGVRFEAAVDALLPEGASKEEVFAEVSTMIANMSEILARQVTGSRRSRH